MKRYSPPSGDGGLEVTFLIRTLTSKAAKPLFVALTVIRLSAHG